MPSSALKNEVPSSRCYVCGQEPGLLYQKFLRRHKRQLLSFAEDYSGKRTVSEEWCFGSLHRFDQQYGHYPHR